MLKPVAAARISLDAARLLWHRKQGLASAVKGSLDEIIDATGWPRSLGGVDVYLAVRARVPGMKRADLDAAVADRRLCVVPAVRGCMYLVPRARVPAVLRLAEEQHRPRMDRELERAGVEPKEIDDVGEAVLESLRKGPLSPDGIRKALPAGAVRSLGERGKKVGLTSPLPPALRRLEFQGKVERSHEDGRLDSERYVWGVPKRNPFAGAKVPADPAARNAIVVESFLRHAAPASVADIAAWSGLARKEVDAALAKLPVAWISVDGYAGQAVVLEDDLPALRGRAKTSAAPALLPFEDNFVVHHGGPSLLTDPSHHGQPIEIWGRTTERTTIGSAKHISCRSLLLGDRIAGFWEFDLDTRRVVVGTFEHLPAARKKSVRALAEDQARFLAEETGHAKCFSLDTEAEIRKRTTWVRSFARA